MFDFFEFSNELLCLADQRGYFTRVNGAWTRTLGWSSDELTQQPYTAFVHPEDLAATLREAELLQTGKHQTIRFENRYRDKAGAYHWLAWNATVEPESGVVIAAARDVTEQKLQDEALHEAEERFHAFMNHSPAIAWAKDIDGKYVYLNRACDWQLGMRLEECAGKTDFEIWPAEIAEKFRANDCVVRDTGMAIQVIEETGRAGQRRYWFSTKFLSQDRAGRKYVNGIAVEITDLKRSEQALRTEQELLRNLIHVQENEKQFICHEFHDGLIQYAVGALMFLESHQRKHPPTDGTSSVDLAINSLRKGIEDGRRVIRGIRPAALDGMGVAAAIDDLLGQFASSGIAIEFDCDPNLGRLPQPVEMTVYRVVQEALNNARKYSGTDRITIQVRRDGFELLVEVRDFGSGFDVPSAWRRGFGLLGMTERVRLLGGDCEIQSRPGEGTRVSFRLPIPHDRPVDEDSGKLA
ncbi:MAG: PAS domain S-box protein [Pirellulaceae bacterium]|nr:PAS domain S-box protein [Pirellulaceae bacterium]